MNSRSEFRVAVGSPSGPRSSVWKFFVSKNDVYVIGGTYEGNCKLSLHESGACQFSGTSTWVLAEPGRWNADRHFVTWNLPRPAGRASQHTFQIQIPSVELRVSAPAEDLSSVHWLPEPSSDIAVSLECYFTGPSDSDPTYDSNLLFPCLFALQLADRRWVVVLYRYVPCDKQFLTNIREQIVAHHALLSVSLDPASRAIAFSREKDGARMLIELCMTTSVSALQSELRKRFVDDGSIAS